MGPSLRFASLSREVNNHSTILLSLVDDAELGAEQASNGRCGQVGKESGSGILQECLLGRQPKAGRQAGKQAGRHAGRHAGRESVRSGLCQ